jgi:short subunit dehydrogenase-like uncharacterized protein
MATARLYDLVLFGATGFTGELTAEYLARAAVREQFRWAIAGRNRDKLERLKRRLVSINPALRESLGLITADSADPQSLRAMAAASKVVITTVGPYIQHGEPLVRACVDADTDYADLTGEPEFVDLLIQRYGREAAKRKLRIVNSCGFDSIPHDLGAWFTLQALQQGLSPVEAAREVNRVEGFVRAGGTFSGGTWHSAILAFSRARHLMKGGRRTHIRASRVIKPVMPTLRYRAELDSWACPFPSIDPQVVRRSAKLLEEYGQCFEYGHYV